MRNGFVWLGAAVVFGWMVSASTLAGAVAHHTSVISVPEQANVTLRFAAGELATYFKAMNRPG